MVHGPGIDEPLAREQGSTRLYYHADGLGSIVAMTDATGAVVSTRREVWPFAKNPWWTEKARKGGRR